MIANLRIAIVGGGLGGTTLATLLQAQGYQVQIYEQSPRHAQLGFGIDLSANAMCVMRHIGLEDRLPHPGLTPTARHNRAGDTGRMLYDQPVAEWHAKYGKDLVMMRSDMHTALIAGLSPGTIDWGKKLVAIDDGETSTLHFADGSRAEADVVVGADGVNSRVRQVLLGPTPPMYSGIAVFRSAFACPSFIEHPVADSTKWWTEDRYFLNYYMTGARDQMCIIAGFKQGAWDMSVSSVPATHDEVREVFKSFHPEVQSVIDEASNFSKWPLLIHDPLPLWSVGNIVLLGDACHPMKPHMGQGAATALEDAVMLTRCFAEESDPQHAFARYKLNRIERTSALQEESLKNRWLKTETDPGWVYGYDVFSTPLKPLPRA